VQHISSPRFAEKVIRFWQLVIVKVRFNLRSEAAQSYLSYAWWILEPLLQISVYYIVFNTFLHRGTENFISFLLCGVVPWLWFSRSINNSTRSIMAGKGLISQTYIPKPFFPLVIVGQDSVKQVVVFVLFIGTLISTGYDPTIKWLWLIPIIITQLTLIIALSLFVAFIVPFARDIQYLISAGLMMAMFGSGIFYSYKEVLLPAHREIFLLNPMANLIVNYRRVLLEDSVPMGGSLAVIAIISCLFIGFMYLLMKRYDNVLTRLALE